MAKHVKYKCACCGKAHDAIETKILMWVAIEDGEPQAYQGNFCTIACLKDYLTEFEVPEGTTIH